MKRVGLIFTMLVLIGVLFNTIRLPGQAAVLATITPTNTPTPTTTPTPTRRLPVATPTPLITALIKQLAFGSEEFDPQLFNGILPGCPLWKDLAPAIKQKPKLPFVFNAGRNWGTNQFCIYGLNADNGLTVTLTRPDGSQKETAQLRSDSLGTFATLSQTEPFPDKVTGYSIPGDPPALTLKLWLPAGLPTGKWQITASTPDDKSAHGAFTINSSLPLPALGLTKPHVGLYPAKANPFNLPVVDKSCQPASRGSTVQLFVVNLAGNTDYVLGGYRLDPNDDQKIVLVDRIRFHTNGKGNQTIKLQLNADMETGQYHILMANNPNARQWWDAGPSVCLDVQ